MGIERHGDDRRVVGPVFEERAPPFQQVVELLRPVASAPGGQNHMVGALDRGDAVDLDEAQPLDQTCKIFSLRRAPKAVPVEEQLPGSPVGEARQRLTGTATHENLAPIPRTRSESLHSLQCQEFFSSLPGPPPPSRQQRRTRFGTSPASGVTRMRWCEMLARPSSTPAVARSRRLPRSSSRWPTRLPARRDLRRALMLSSA